MIKEELLSIINKWSLPQLDIYIEELEVRASELGQLIRELKQLRKKKVGRKTQDNGHRTGD